MLRAIVISRDSDLAERLMIAVAETGMVAFSRRLEDYPATHELARIFRAHAPHVFLIDVARLESAVEVAEAVQAELPGVQVIAFGTGWQSKTLLELMRAGVREFVAIPEGLLELRNTLARVSTALERTPPAVPFTEEVLAFLPSKPGVGCSTVALNTSMALAADARVLLADFDLNCGVLAFMLHLDASYSLVDAAEHAHQLDEDMWPKLVAKSGKLDLLPSGLMRPGFRIELPAVRYLLDFARRNYDVVCADLSGLMERYSVEILHESKRIFLVATPELPALHLARQKLDYLRSLGLDSRVSLLLNRSTKRNPINAAEIEKAIGVPVALEVPNDYRAVHRALSEAAAVPASTDLGKVFAELARRILDKQKEPEKKTARFIDQFVLNPARYSLVRR